jgi:hypothetical protein
MINNNQNDAYIMNRFNAYMKYGQDNVNFTVFK